MAHFSEAGVPHCYCFRKSTTTSGLLACRRERERDKTECLLTLVVPLLCEYSFRQCWLARVWRYVPAVRKELTMVEVERRHISKFVRIKSIVSEEQAVVHAQSFAHNELPAARGPRRYTNSTGAWGRRCKKKRIDLGFRRERDEPRLDSCTTLKSS